MSEPVVAGRRQWQALAVCLASAFVNMLDVSIVNVAMPSIESSLRAGTAELQLIVAGYTLAFALTVVPAGRLGDVHGRKKMLMIGVTGFGVCSLLAGLSVNDWMLAAARVAQGVCAGLANPQVSGLIQQLFPGKQRGRAFGYLGTLVGVATATGPLAGGAIIALAGTEHGWRWIFFINVPIVAVVVPLAARLLPGKDADRSSTKLDFFGVALIGVGTLTFMTPFVLSERSASAGGPGNERWLLLIVAFALLPVAYFWERHYHRRFRAAVFDPRLLRNAGFCFGAAIGFVYFASFTSLFLIVTMVLQAGLGFSALQAGLTAMPYALGSGLAASLAGRRVAKHGRKLVVAGLCLALVGMSAIQVVLRFAPTQWVAVSLACAMLLTGLGSGTVVSPNQTLTLAHVPVEIGGVAGGMLQVSQQIGSAVGMAVVLAGFFANQVAMGERQAAAHSLLVSMALIALAVGVAVADWRRTART
ncbi:MAG: MFS transporter [Propionibacteriaceae bacterium]|nr:MFS transporter [Propionibacteriaceae bacterium]